MKYSAPWSPSTEFRLSRCMLRRLIFSSQCLCRLPDVAQRWHRTTQPYRGPLLQVLILPPPLFFLQYASDRSPFAKNAILSKQKYLRNQILCKTPCGAGGTTIKFVNVPLRERRSMNMFDKILKKEDDFPTLIQIHCILDLS